MKKTIITAIILLLAFAQSATAAKRKWVLLVDIINKEKNANVAYLESSITDAIREKLKETFVFSETKKEIWAPVAKENYLYKDEWDQKSVSMNLGLLTKQDVLISGSYRIESSGKKGVPDQIITHIRIFNISKKRIIADFIIKGFADKRIWDSVKEIAERIVKETARILPSKADWKKKGIVLEEDREPWLSNVSIGIGAGAGIYVEGWADYWDAEQPGVNFNLKTFVSRISKNLLLQFDFFFIRHELSTDKPTALSTMDLSSVTSNYFLNAFIGYRFCLSDTIFIEPKIGAGYLFQSSKVIGEYQQTANNSLPTGAFAIDLVYMLNRSIDLNLSSRIHVEMEDEIITYLPAVLVGVELKL
jgi:hypothetical protein